MDKISKKQALVKGLNRFFTGVPCKNGHVCERYVVSCECVECKKLDNLPRPWSPRRSREDIERSRETRALLEKTCREAATLGKVVFDWHIPCKKGHIAGRYVKDRKCVKCRSGRNLSAATKDRMAIFPPPPEMPKIVSSAEAKKMGSSRFFTGKPCKYGHYAERYVSSGRCISCTNPIPQAVAPVREQTPEDNFVQNFVQNLHKKRQQSMLSVEVEKNADEANRPPRSGKGFDFQEFLRRSWANG